MTQRQLHSGLNVLSAGMHAAAWLAKESNPLDYIKPEQWLHLVRIAERETFDLIFLSDEPGLNLSPDQTLRGPSWAALDPLVLLASLASVSAFVGLAGTVSTTYEEPYNIARRFASLDHVSRGRAAWNMVTALRPSLLTWMYNPTTQSIITDKRMDGMSQVDSDLLAIAAQLMPDGSDNLNSLLTALVYDVAAEKVRPQQGHGHISRKVANESRSRIRAVWFSLRHRAAVRLSANCLLETDQD
jgi:hypothetical protein